ncbi:MAG: DUF1877 family protein [Gemmataceae bacterium]
MGVNAGLYVIPARKFATAQQKVSWDRYRWNKCRPWFDIDKAWSQFDDVLKGRSDALRYVIKGDVRIARNEPGFNFVSPPVVGQITRELAAIPITEVFAAIERTSGRTWTAAQRKVEQGYYERFYEELCKAYQEAAAQGAALGVLLC